MNETHLADRLKAQERGLAQSPTACSRLLDLDDLDARLRQVSSDNSFSLRLNPQTIERLEPSTPPFDPEVERTRYEIDLIKDVFGNPDQYSDMLRGVEAA
ncbi:hypothetical protein B0T17DRAFT_620533 [Bombardia bombarda]|uniref:Uncharacterized protein n=1 Tax=Bombardia bombarda TaxID=252184 RepID=A0AA39W4S0_9PEZI|nr:hypothetical protein B0T17DRAFT_620533 [Bombardia bombarda]